MQELVAAATDRKQVLVGESATARRATLSPRPSRRARRKGIHVRLLGSFALICQGKEVSVPMSAQRVIAFIALQRRPLLRRFVAGSLWLDSSEAHAQASLRSALWRLNRCGLNPVHVDDQRLRLDDHVEVDLYQAEATARFALAGSSVEELEIDPTTLGTDLLPDWYDDWTLLEREGYRQLRLQALDTLCEQLVRAGRLNDALAAGLTAVAGDPLRESGHRALVRVYLAAGNAGDAVRQYHLCQRLLGDELGLEPSERMQELIGTLEAATVC